MWRFGEQSAKGWLGQAELDPDRYGKGRGARTSELHDDPPGWIEDHLRERQETLDGRLELGVDAPRASSFDLDLRGREVPRPLREHAKRQT
jgi:hypothetical protein